MKKKISIITLAILIPAVLYSATFEQISVTSGAVVTPTAAKIAADGVYPSGAIAALCTLETASIRWTCDGTTPTSTVGHLMTVGEALEITGHKDIVDFKAIAPSTTGTLSCTYSFTKE